MSLTQKEMEAYMREDSRISDYVPTAVVPRPSNTTPPKVIDELISTYPPKQIGGNHYSKLKIQPVDYIVANNIGYLEGNVLKYISRHKNKNGKEDILKAIHYCELILEKEYNETM